MSKRGRPSTRSPELAEAICQRLAAGESLRSICADDAMPGMFMVLRWLADDGEFATQYARAREAQADHETDEIKEIADERPEVDGKMDSAFVAWQRNRIDARKWRASKLAPKKYGDKLDLEHSGSVGLKVTRADESVL